MGDQWEQGRKGNIRGPMRWRTNEFKRFGGDLWIGAPAGEKGPMIWGTSGVGGGGVGANWGTNEIGDQWDGGPLGLAEIGWINENGDQWKGGPMSSNNVVLDLWIGGQMRMEPMRWGTIEMGDQWVGGTNEMGDQWNGWYMGVIWGTNEMGGWWVGGPMRWGTNEMGDQWDGGPLGLADDGVTNEKGDQWDGGPMRWGTNELQWCIGGPMSWGTNEKGTYEMGDQWEGGPVNGSRRIHTMISKLQGYVYRQLLYQGGTSLVPCLVGPPCHWFPISLVPISLVPHISGPPINTHPPTIPLPPHWSPRPIDPPSHRSPGSQVTLSIYCLNPLVPLLIGLVPFFIHRPIPTALYHTDPPFSTHAPPFPLLPHLLGQRKGFFIGSISMVPNVTLVT